MRFFDGFVVYFDRLAGTEIPERVPFVISKYLRLTRLYLYVPDYYVSPERVAAEDQSFPVQGVDVAEARPSQDH